MRFDTEVRWWGEYCSSNTWKKRREEKTCIAGQKISDRKLVLALRWCQSVLMQMFARFGNHWWLARFWKKSLCPLPCSSLQRELSLPAAKHDSVPWIFYIIEFHRPAQWQQYIFEQSLVGFVSLFLWTNLLWIFFQNIKGIQASIYIEIIFYIQGYAIYCTGSNSYESTITVTMPNSKALILHFQLKNCSKLFRSSSAISNYQSYS